MPSKKTKYPILETIDVPEDLRRLSPSDLTPLAKEVREFLIESISQCGGHLGAGLGTVELAVALHYVFNTPEDRLVWDVGHQAYPHKILTGRRDRLPTIRKKGGLAPFLRRSESPYDSFGAGHSSTSISAALGMAIAAAHQKQDRKAVAIIGDGGMTAGLAYEALDHGGDLKSDVLVILNHNDMSMRASGEKVLRHSQSIWRLAHRTSLHVKGMVVPGTLFEELGFDYFGPIDGHDLPTLVKTLKNLRSLPGPRLLHVVTCKGKGYARAEADPVKYHGVAPFDPKVGIVGTKRKSTPAYSQVFGEWLCDMAEQDDRLVGITPAMREGSGLVEFERRFPDRYFDVGIAEQHSVCFAAGLAADGLKPVVAIYSTFLQRAYDQLIHDVVVQDLPVLFAIDRAGVVGPDGATHNGSYDLSFMRCLPNMVIMAPADENECRQMLYTGYLLDQPAAVRYPRGRGPGVEVTKEMTALPIGKAEVRCHGHSIALLAFGSMLTPALAVGEILDATVINMRFVKPLDQELVLHLADTHELLVTIEDNVVAGGAGSAVNECLMACSKQTAIMNLGLADKLIETGTREEMLTEAGLDEAGILRSIEKRYRLMAPHKPVADAVDQAVAATSRVINQ
jgi:1-deoxy-D-xylulose-5-phosphate synthase